MRSNELQWWKLHAAGLAVCAGMTVIVFVAGVRPALAQHRQRLALRATLAQQRQQAAAASAAVSDLKQQFTAYQRQLSSLPLRLQDVGQLNRKLADVAALAAENALEVAAVQPGQPERAERYLMVPLRLSGIGTYSACSAFLRQLHERAADLGVWAVRLRAEAAPSDRAAFEFALVWFAAPTPANKP